jgi:hypothetical protein
MKKVFVLLVLLSAIVLNACTTECDCEVKKDGTIECPC